VSYFSCVGPKVWIPAADTDYLSLIAEKEGQAKTLQLEQAEVSKLKMQIADEAKLHAADKARLEREVQELRAAAEAASKRTEEAHRVSLSLRKQLDAWREQFALVQAEMHGSCVFLAPFCS
jgi:peptidoglycan hydrolase CwlO-like protein